MSAFLETCHSITKVTTKWLLILSGIFWIFIAGFYFGEYRATKDNLSSYAKLAEYKCQQQTPLGQFPFPVGTFNTLGDEVDMKTDFGVLVYRCNHFRWNYFKSQAVTFVRVNKNDI